MFTLHFTLKDGEEMILEHALPANSKEVFIVDDKEIEIIFNVK